MPALITKATTWISEHIILATCIAAAGVALAIAVSVHTEGIQPLPTEVMPIEDLPQDKASDSGYQNDHYQGDKPVDDYYQSHPGLRGPGDVPYIKYNY
jgi:hypothetical protein